MKKPQTYEGNYDDELEDKANDENGATALLPKSLLQGRDCTVGDTITLKVTAVRDGEVQVVPTGGAAPPEPEEPAEEPVDEMMPEEGAPEEGNYD